MTISEYLYKLCFFIGINQDDLKIVQEEEGEKIAVTINAPDETAEKLIGHRGQGLRAIKLLLNTTFFEEIKDKKLFFDINDSIKNREEDLINHVAEIAQVVIETGQPQTLYDLNSYERFLVHSEITNNEKYRELGSYSTSVGFKRFLTICLKEDLPNVEEG